MKKTLKQLLSGFLALALVAVMLPPLSLSADALSYSGSASYQSGSYSAALAGVQLTGNQAQDIVAVALSQVGYTEGNSNKQLSGSAEGNGNYTEYGWWYGLQDMWCAMFVSWCANRAGIGTSVIPKHSFTPDGLNKFIDWNRAYSRKTVAGGGYTPKAGDIVYFKNARNNNKCNHVGIVTGWSGGTLYTVEGNSDNAVQTRSYSIGDSTIVYICHPNYSGGSISVPQSDSGSGGCFPRCSSSYTSIVNALNSIGVDSSYSYRKTIAAANGISNYTGSASQNVQMLNLLKAGTLKKPGGSGSSAAPANAAGTWYLTTALNPGLAIDAAGGATANGTNIQLWEVNLSAAQIYDVNSVGGGWYIIVQQSSGQALDVSGGSAASGTNVQLWELNYSDAQLWRFLPAPGGGFYIQNKLGCYLDVSGGNGVSGNNIWVYSGNQTSAQVFFLNSVGAAPSASAAPCFPRCSASCTSIVDALNSIGVNSSYSYRKTIAAANGISNYTGTSSQNIQLLNLLKAGTLKRP